VINYGEPTNSPDRGSFINIIYNCNGKLIQRCGRPYIINGIGIPFCEFFIPYTQLNFPFPNAKIDTLVFDLRSGEQFDCSNKLKCGSVRYGNTSNGSEKYDQYLCSYNLMGGKEIIYEFDKKANQSAVFHLSDVIRDLDLFVLSKNDQDFCVKHSSKDGQSFENIFLEASLPAGTYYVVVDGFNTNTSSYKLTVECDKPEGILDCNKAKTINCNESQSGNTTLDGISMNQFYGSSSSVFYDGKEVIYKLIAPFDGVIDILLENLNSDLDLFVFDDCGNKLNPLEFSIEANKEEEAILLSVLKGKTYFIVIDSRFEMEGNFTLSITCTDCTCNNPPCVPPPPLICQDKIQLFCNEPKLGDTRTSNYQRIKQYGCGGVTKGKELLYYFELNSAQKVDIFIRNILPGNNLKLIVLDSCNPYTAKCLASGNKSNESNEAIRLNLAKGVYYIYVDGYLDKDASSFEIEIKCEKIECDKNPILVSFDSTNVNCSYNIEVKPKDGVPPYTYKWSNGMTTAKLTGVPPGKYIVTVTDKKLCSKVDSVLVNSSCKPACDTTIKGNTLFGKSNYYKYECSDHKMDGNEIIYEFDNPSTQNVVISLTDLVQDLDLFLLEYVTPMNPDRCVKSSTRTDGSYESIFVENLPKGKYYIVVEGYNKRASSFTLKIDCPKPRGFLDCANAQNVECRKTYSGNTMLGVANNNYYEGKSPVYYDGKELVYKFVAPQGIVKVNAYLEKLTSDVDFFMVENCGNFVKSTRASTESNLSNEVIIFSPVAGKTYYFVVDNPKGLEGNFNLRLKCYGTCLVGCDTINPIDCTKKIRLDCNKPLPDNNFNGTSINDSYCSGDALGKERLYYFEIKTAQEVEIILNELNKGKNLNIYLIKDCVPDGPDGSCLAIGNKSGDADEVIIKNLAAGIYYIWVDGFLETDESTYTIEVRCKDIDCSNSPMNLSFTTAKINCNYNVSVNINSGGIPSFSYKWSNGNTTSQLNNVPSGNYAVTVTDKIFCQKDTSINLPSFRTTKTVKIDSTICFGKCITFGKNTICTTGAYSETFFVAASCLDSIVTLNLTVAAPLMLPTVVSGVDCKYNLTVNPSGGKAPYRFSWQGGNSGNSRNGLAPGSYSLTVTDAVGCQKDTIFKLVPLDITITNKIDSADCGKANGRIEIVTVNKIKSAVWQDNTTNSLVRENLKAGRYTLTLTDVNGCIKRFDFEVGEKDNCGCNFYTAISPNGDGKNDYFFIDCKKKGCPDVLEVCFPENEIVIFNRWGNVVFKAKPYKNDWDAQGLPDGVYYYQFRRDPNSKVEMGSIIVKK
jgi:gliding motility-associated-like protein